MVIPMGLVDTRNKYHFDTATPSRPADLHGKLAIGPDPDTIDMNPDMEDQQPRRSICRMPRAGRARVRRRAARRRSSKGTDLPSPVPTVAARRGLSACDQAGVTAGASKSSHHALATTRTVTKRPGASPIRPARTPHACTAGVYIEYVSQHFLHMHALPDIQLLKVGRCIYCGTTANLEDEHLVPAALNGNQVLGDASCRDCAKKTSAFESQFTNAIRDVRAALSMGTKRRKAKTTTASAHLLVGGRRQTIRLPYADHPNLVVLPEFPLPGCLAGREPDLPLSTVGQPVVLSYGVHPLEVARAHGASEISFEQRMPNEAFAKLVAKIAYGQAMADLPVDAFAEAFVLPPILGAVGANIAHWVGTCSRTSIAAPDPNTLHRIRTHLVPAEVEGGLVRFVVGEVTLFANAPAPEYLVVVGLLRGDLPIPEKFAPAA